MKNKLFFQDVQFHTNFSDGENTILEMVDSIFISGLKSCIVTDHAKGWASKNEHIEFFSSADKYSEYLKEIDKIKSIYTNSLKIYSGLEIEIDMYGNYQLDKGIIDYVEKEHNEKTLGVDVILGSIHSESVEEESITPRQADGV
jgi:HisJ family histidinol phosphate phosphatase